MRVLRTLAQSVFLAGVIALLARGLAGLTPNTCETYCPFGGLVAIFPLARYKAYTCALTELNVALLVSLIALTLTTKKSFCSWVCPLGTIQEWIGRVGKKTFGRYGRLPGAADRWLMPLRYVVLGFRAYDPFYILFTWGGHEVAAFSMFIVIGVLAATFFLPFAWCRYVCPLGAMMDPLSRVGGFRLRRNAETCTDCGRCDTACPHAVPVSTVDEVTARNCTNCLDCVSECPEKGALELSWFGK